MRQKSSKHLGGAIWGVPKVDKSNPLSFTRISCRRNWAERFAKAYRRQRRSGWTDYTRPGLHIRYRNIGWLPSNLLRRLPSMQPGPVADRLLYSSSTSTTYAVHEFNQSALVGKNVLPVNTRGVSRQRCSQSARLVYVLNFPLNLNRVLDWPNTRQLYIDITAAIVGVELRYWWHQSTWHSVKFSDMCRLTLFKSWLLMQSMPLTWISFIQYWFHSLINALFLWTWTTQMT